MTEEKKSMVPKLRFPEFTETWEQRKLKDFTLSYSGGTPTVSNKNYYNGTIPFIRSGEISGERTELFITEEGLNKSSAKSVHKGQILYALYGATSGEVSLSKIDGAINQAILAISTKEGYSNAFLSFWLRKEKDRITATFLQGGQGNLSGEIVKNLIVPIPSQLEQTKIGDFFNQLDGIITLHQRKLDVLNKLKKYLLQKMFPENGQLIPELRFPAFSGAWEQRKLSEIVRMNARIGWQNLRQSEFLDDGDFLLITGTDFKNGRVNFGTCHYIAKERFDQDPKIQVEEGSILLTKDGTIGKVALVDKLSKPATLNAGVYNIVPKNRVVESRFLFQYLSAPFLLDYVNKAATGGTIKHLNQSILVDFPVSFPSVAEQEKIGKFLEGIDHVTTLHQRKLEGLRKLKKSLLQQMFV